MSVQANLVLEGGQVKIVASNLYFGPEGKADFSIPAALEPVVLGLFSYTIDPQALPYGIQPSLVYAEGGRIVIEGSAENTTIDLAELQNR